MDSQISQYSSEWFKERQGCFSGSSVWKLMTNPRSKSETISKTAETHIIEKVWEALSGLTVSGIDNFATEWGNTNEPIAKQWYGKLTGIEVQSAPLVYMPDLEGFVGSPDGYVGEDGIIEIKCPYNGANHLKHCFITNDEYFKSEHPEYYWQCQSYMMLTGRNWTDFVSFDPRIDTDFGLFIYRLKYNAEDCEELKSRIIKARELFKGYYESFKGQKM